MLSEPALALLHHQHLTIDQMVSGCSTEQLQKPLAPGKWSIHDQVAHLSRYQFIFQERIHEILLTSSPSFDRYLAENDDQFETWRSQSFEALMHSLKTERIRIIGLFSALQERELSRIGNHPRFGQLTVEAWLSFFLAHEGHHLFSIYQLAFPKS